MHELSLAQDLMQIIRQVAGENNAEQVNSATVAIGELAGIEADALQFAFEVVRKDSVAANCVLLVEHIPLQVRCAACGYAGIAPRDKTGCPACAQVPVEVTGGREMRLLSIDVEDEHNA